MKPRIRGAMLLAALSATVLSACDGSSASSRNPINAESVSRVFGIPSAPAGPSETRPPDRVSLADEFPLARASAPSVPGAARYVPAIKVPASCPQERIVLASWNLSNFGKTKEADEIAVMADVLREADAVLVQEVSTVGGAQAAARLRGALSRTGAQWDALTSPPTEPRNPESEAYSVLWKASRLTADRRNAGLVPELRDAVSREPFSVTFLSKGGIRFTAYSFHALPAKKRPDREIRALAESEELAGARSAVVAGDFNLPAAKVERFFVPKGFSSAVVGKTTLRKAVTEKGEYLLHDYDQIYVKGLSACGSGIADFASRGIPSVTDESLRRSRAVSDHLPVWVAVH